MKKYYVGNALLKNNNKDPSLISFDGRKYRMEGTAINLPSLADAIASRYVKYENLPVKVKVKKYKPAVIVPFTEKELLVLKTEVRRARRDSLDERL